MGKLLKVLVVLLLLLSIGTLVLSLMLFGKREELTGRTRRLENAIIQMGKTIEMPPATGDVSAVDYPEKDISPCTSEEIEKPELSEIWKHYSPAFETPAAQPAMLDLDKKKTELMSYYRRDPYTGGLAKGADGRPVDRGEGTLQGVVDDLLAKAADQYQRLNQTRHVLQEMRKNLVTTIEELNKSKTDLRTALKKQEALQAETRAAQAEAQAAKQRAEELAEEKKTLEDKAKESENKVAALEEDRRNKEDAIAALKKEIADLRRAGPMVAPVATDQPQPTPGAAAPHVEPGFKGHIAAVNTDWNFVLIRLTDEFLKSLLGEDLSRPPPPSLDLHVKRSGDQGSLVTKIRLTQVRKGTGLGVADIVRESQQMPVQEGDVVFF